MKLRQVPEEVDNEEEQQKLFSMFKRIHKVQTVRRYRLHFVLSVFELRKSLTLYYVVDV